MAGKKKEQQLTIDFTAAAKSQAKGQDPPLTEEKEGSNRKLKSHRTPQSMEAGQPSSAEGSMRPSDETTKILKKIEGHLAAIRQQQVKRPRAWLAIEDVAEELQVSRDTIERLIAAGKLRAAPMTTSEGDGTRRMYRIKPEWLEEFLNSLAPKKPPSRSSVRRPRSKTGEVDFID